MIRKVKLKYPDNKNRDNLLIHKVIHYLVQPEDHTHCPDKYLKDE